MGDFQREKRKYADEVDTIAARLVREGYAPYDAIEKAGRIVRERRQRRLWKRWELEAGKQP